MAAPTGLSAGVFDLGGVLIDWNPRHLYRKLFAADPEGMERFLAQMCTPAWNRELDRGRPFGAAVAELQQRYPAQAELIGAYLERWPEMLGEVDRGTVEILRELRDRGLRLFALSDWSTETYPLARPLVPELELFDDVLISGEVGWVKPEPELFATACRRFGVSPHEAFFVDDVAVNVEGARHFGFTALQFTGADALRKSLGSLGLL